MKTGKLLLLSAALLSAAAASGGAMAQRSGHYGGHYGGHGGGYGGWHHGGYGNAGAFIGGAIVAGALLSPWYYPNYYYRPYPTVVEVVPQPSVYIEQPAIAAAPASDANNWWYYCNDTRTYYPYVRECASPWQQVAPQAPATR